MPIATPLVTGSSTPDGFTPSQIRQAYDFNNITFENNVVGDGSGQTIAIVDQGYDPDIANDLEVFDQQFGLPAATLLTAEPDGDPGPPQNDSNGSPWGLEIAMDIEWAHALAPGATILYVAVPPPSSTPSGLLDGVGYARNQPGVSVVSMSWGTSMPLTGNINTNDGAFTTPSGHQNVAFIAGSGDSGAPGGWPAQAPNVLAVGGTDLSLIDLDSQGDQVSYGGELAWSKSGGGVDPSQPQSSAQQFYLGTASGRELPDVAFDAGSGVAVYDSYDYGAGTGWNSAGGTSLGAPAWAALVAIADQGAVTAGQGTLDNDELGSLYEIYKSGCYSDAFHDVTTEDNGTSLGTGYNLVTGLGSPIVNIVVAALSQDVNGPFLMAPGRAVGVAPATPYNVALSTTTPTFQWSPAEGAVAYDLTVIDTSTGATAINYLTINGTSYTPTTPLLNGHNYQWTVQAMDATGNLVLSSQQTFQFSVNTLPPPTALSPSGIELSSAEPTLEWSAVSGVAAYTAYILDTTTNTFIESLGAGGTSVTLPTPLSFGESYEWFVASNDPQGGDTCTACWSFPGVASQPLYFTVEAIAAPSPVAPAAGATVTTTTPTFQWSPVPGAVSYGLMVTDLMYSDAVSIQDLQINGTSYTPSIPLVYAHEYEWSLRTYTVSDGLPYLSTWSTSEFFDVSRIAAPALTSPGTQATVPTTTPELQWSAVAGATTYSVSLVDLTSGGSPYGVLDVSGTSVTVPPLNDGDSYAWMVQASDGSGDSSGFSAPFILYVAKTAAGTGGPGPANPESPSGDVTTDGATFQWSAVSGASLYGFYLEDMTSGTTEVWDVSSPITDTGSLTNGDTYKWWVVAYDSSGDAGPSSSPLTFTFDAYEPFGTITTSTPTFQWPAGSKNGSYILSVYDDTTKTTAIPWVEVSGTSFTPAVPLKDGDSYSWMIEASGLNGSLGASFTVSQTSGGTTSLAAPTLSGPSGALTTGTPTLQWSSVPGAIGYGLFLIDTTLNTLVMAPLVVQGTSYTPSSSLGNGRTYIWWVTAFDGSGDVSPPSSSLNFNVSALSNGLGVPTPIAPVASTDAEVPTFEWSAVPGANDYDLTVIDVTQDSAVVANDEVSGTSTDGVELTAAFGDEFEWYVAAVATSGVVGVAASQTFHLVAPTIGPPTPAAPVNGADVATTTPTLQWSAVAGTSSYTVTLWDANSSAGDIVFTTVDGTSYTIPTPLLNLHSYLWTVAADVTVNGSATAGPVSSEANFLVSLPGTPTLGAVAGLGTTTTPTFQWSAVAGAAYYGLFLVDLTMYLDVLNGLVVDGTSYTVIAPLNVGDNYQWDVIAYDNSGDGGAPSQISVFSVALNVGAPGLTAPSSTVTTELPELEWSTVSGASTYDVYLQDTTTGTMIVDGDQVTGTSYTPGAPLNDGDSYQWCVTALDGLGDVSSAPQALDFNVSLAVDMVPTPDPIAPMGTVTTTTPTFQWSAVPGAVAYYVQIVEVTNGTESEVLYPTYDTATSYTLSTPLLSAGTYQWQVLACDSSGTESAWSTPTQFTLPGTTQLAVVSQPPSSVQPGIGFGLSVSIEDGSDNVVTSFDGSVTVALANNPGGAILGGTLTVSAVNGVATFAGLTLDSTGSGYTLQVSASGMTPVTTDPFDVDLPQSLPLADLGFQTPYVGTGPAAYQYAPAGSSWTFAGGAGLAGNSSGFTASNPLAPQGTQVAFLQQQGQFSQAVELAAGTYTVTFAAAQRANDQASSQTFEVTVDEAVVGTFTPGGTGYTTLTTAPFTVLAGSHTLAFVGLDPNGGDNTAFIDQVAFTAANEVQDPDFSLLNVGTGAAAYEYAPSGSPWTFTGSAGLAGNGSGFTASNPPAPQGTQVAFLQQQGQFSQAVELAAGTYTVTFSAAQRANDQASSQTFEMTVDGSVVGIFTPGGTSYTALTTGPFTVAAGSHTLAFVGLDPNGGDNTAFIDQVAVNPAALGDESIIQDSDFDSPGVGIGPAAYQYAPGGSPWTFTGGAGLAGNGSGFTAGNPPAPQGTQVAFLQQQGQFSQTVELAAGTYTVTFAAAQRANDQASSQTFEVQLDGAVIGTFTPSGSEYTTLSTTTFTVATAGAHELAFLGLDPNGGDNTAFIDQVSFNAANGVQDPSFNTPNVGVAPGAYQYAPSGSPWTFTGGAGLAGNGSGFTASNPPAPQGTQVAFLQETGQISQVFDLAAGNYTVTLTAAQRSNFQASSQTFEVQLDGAVIGTFTPSGSEYTTLSTTTFTVATAGAHKLAFIGLDPNGGDNTAFIDEVSINLGPASSSVSSGSAVITSASLSAVSSLARSSSLFAEEAVVAMADSDIPAATATTPVAIGPIPDGDSGVSIPQSDANLMTSAIEADPGHPSKARAVRQSKLGPFPAGPLSSLRDRRQG
jgi:hypothetical protein